MLSRAALIPPGAAPGPGRDVPRLPAAARPAHDRAGFRHAPGGRFGVPAAGAPLGLGVGLLAPGRAQEAPFPDLWRAAGPPTRAASPSVLSSETPAPKERHTRPPAPAVRSGGQLVELHLAVLHHQRDARPAPAGRTTPRSGIAVHHQHVGAGARRDDAQLALHAQRTRAPTCVALAITAGAPNTSARRRNSSLCRRCDGPAGRCRSPSARRRLGRSPANAGRRCAPAPPWPRCRPAGPGPPLAGQGLVGDQRGTTQAPCPAISRAASASTRLPCSMVRTPQRTAREIASAV